MQEKTDFLSFIDIRTPEVYTDGGILRNIFYDRVGKVLNVIVRFIEFQAHIYSINPIAVRYYMLK